MNSGTRDGSDFCEWSPSRPFQVLAASYTTLGRPRPACHGKHVGVKWLGVEPLFSTSDSQRQELFISSLRARVVSRIDPSLAGARDSTLASRLCLYKGLDAPKTCRGIRQSGSGT